MEPDHLVTAGGVFFGCALFLFREGRSRSDKADEMLEMTYTYMRKHDLDPILHKILGGRKGRHKPSEYFATPEVVMEMHRYRTHLFRFIEASCGKGGALLPLRMAGWSALLAGMSVLAIALALGYGIGHEMLGEYEHALRPAGASVLAMGTAIVMGTMAWHGRAGVQFRAELRRMTGGLRV